MSGFIIWITIEMKYESKIANWKTNPIDLRVKPPNLVSNCSEDRAILSNWGEWHSSIEQNISRWVAILVEIQKDQKIRDFTNTQNSFRYNSWPINNRQFSSLLSNFVVLRVFFTLIPIEISVTFRLEFFVINSDFSWSRIELIFLLLSFKSLHGNSLTS